MCVFCALAALSFFLNVIFLYKPILGAPKSSFTAYLKDWGVNRIIAFCAGIICGLGNTFQFMGGQVQHSNPALNHTQYSELIQVHLIACLHLWEGYPFLAICSGIICGLGGTSSLMSGRVQDNSCTCHPHVKLWCECIWTSFTLWDVQAQTCM